ncbi:MAG: hypothetical protein LBK07_04185 [Tannerella sp.]|nr:hypothetical protein [Tannerella sp.]
MTKISKPKIHYFNPGHEAAIHSGSAHYTPTATVRKMMTDLALLPLWYSDAGDYVWVDNIVDAFGFISTIPHEIRPQACPISLAEMPELYANIISLEAAPWGISPQSIHFFETLRSHLPLLSIPQWNETLVCLTSRCTAIDCLLELSSLTNVMPPQIFTNLNDIQKFMETCPLPCIIKTPFSCSGKGLRWIYSRKWDEPTRRWISGALKKQQSVSIETALDKVCDFAMEFEADGDGHVIFKGLSVFNTSADGAYNGNVLAGKILLEKYLTDFVSAGDLDKVREVVRTVLEKRIGTTYKGLLGVDMLIYRQNASFHIHPFIELNLRRTMGHISLQLGKRLVHPSAQGRFIISCQQASEAYRTHLQMTKKHPLQIDGGKIRSGYFSLCPVAAGTKYRAYVEINSETK